MTIEVLLFARFKDQIGCDRLALTLPDVATVADLRREVARVYPVVAGLLARSAIAIDDDLADDDAPLRHDHQVALLPPVSGGANDQPRSHLESLVLPGDRSTVTHSSIPVRR